MRHPNDLEATLERIDERLTSTLALIRAVRVEVEAIEAQRKLDNCAEPTT